MKRRVLQSVTICLLAGTLVVGTQSMAVLAKETVSTAEADGDKSESLVGKWVFAQCKNHINIHSEASSDSPVTARIYNNGSAKIVSVEENGWLRIKSGNATGYVKPNHFVSGKKAKAIAKETAYTVATVQTDELSIRSEASEDSVVLACAQTGDELEVVEDDGEWLKVARGDGLYGYINASYVKCKTYYPVAKTIEEISEEKAAAKTEAEAAEEPEAMEAEVEEPEEDIYEEPIAEAEEPSYEETAEPVDEEDLYEEIPYEETSYEETSYEEETPYEETSYEETYYEEETPYEEPSYEETSYEETSYEEPSYEETSYVEPFYEDTTTYTDTAADTVTETYTDTSYTEAATESYTAETAATEAYTETYETETDQETSSGTGTSSDTKTTTTEETAAETTSADTDSSSEVGVTYDPTYNGDDYYYNADEDAYYFGSTRLAYNPFANTEEEDEEEETAAE